MLLESVSITNFRNISSLQVEFSSGVNIFSGDNSSGKTNLLEAIFVLCLGRSPRTAAEGALFKDGCDFYRLEGDLSCNEKNYHLSVACQKGNRKKVTLDKVQIRVAELYEKFCAVTGGPEDSEIISGSPAARRTFVDIYLSQFSPKYLNNLSNYQKVLAQKNASLKNEIEPAPYNELLIEYGSAIMKARLDFLEAVKVLSVKFYNDISGGGNLNLAYQPLVQLKEENHSLNEIKEMYELCLKKYAERERVMKISMVGPHRDEVFFSIDSLPARTHGSQGEWRTAALSLKLAIYHLLKEKRKTEPLLLLDEIFAELDEKRSEALMILIEKYKQIFLTTAVESPAFLKNDSKIYIINRGEITLTS